MYSCGVGVRCRVIGVCASRSVCAGTGGHTFVWRPENNLEYYALSPSFFLRQSI